MPLEIVRNDITKMAVDAIVNAANPSLPGGGGVDGAIHRAAGPQLLEECRGLKGCETGEAKITGGYQLPCKYVIHTVGPVWQGGRQGEEALLRACYRRSLELAKAHGCETVAFPLISTGVYGYPKDRAMKVAMDEIARFLRENDMTVSLVVFPRDAFEIGGKLFRDVRAYIDHVYVDEHPDARREERRWRFGKAAWREGLSSLCGKAARREGPASLPGKGARRQEREEEGFGECYAPMRSAAPLEAGLDEMLKQMDESFAQMLLRKIDEKGMTDAQCYKRANVDRRLFHKIRNNPSYKPGKQTVLAFAIALELSLEEAKDMLMKAGFALSHSNKADIVVEYCIMTGNYDIMEINQILFQLDLPLLGY